MRLLFYVLLAFSGCGFIPLFIKPCPADYTDTRYEAMRYTNYVVPRTTKSKLGIAIGPGVDGDKVDQLTKEVESCMGVTVKTCAIHAVMIAPDWYVSPDYTHTQIFPCRDTPPENLCMGVNQWPSTIITTPNLASYKWELVRLLTHSTPTKCF